MRIAQNDAMLEKEFDLRIVPRSYFRIFFILVLWGLGRVPEKGYRHTRCGERVRNLRRK